MCVTTCVVACNKIVIECEPFNLKEGSKICAMTFYQIFSSQRNERKTKDRILVRHKIWNQLQKSLKFALRNHHKFLVSNGRNVFFRNGKTVKFLLLVTHINTHIIISFIRRDINFSSLHFPSSEKDFQEAELRREKSFKSESLEGRRFMMMIVTLK